MGFGAFSSAYPSFHLLLEGYGMVEHLYLSDNPEPFDFGAFKVN
jgi:hypothetical protein